MDRCWSKRRSNAPIAAIAHIDSDSSQVAPSGHTLGSNMTLSVVDFKTIVNQIVLSRSGNTSSSILSVLLSTSFLLLFDSAYFNHMTPHPTSFTTFIPSPHY